MAESVLLHQDPSSVVLNLVDQVNALARVPDEESLAVIQPGGDQGVKLCHTLVWWLAASHWVTH